MTGFCLFKYVMTAVCIFSYSNKAVSHVIAPNANKYKLIKKSLCEKKKLK